MAWPRHQVALWRTAVRTPTRAVKSRTCSRRHGVHNARQTTHPSLLIGAAPVDLTQPETAVKAWMSAHDYLRLHAAHAWALQMRSGIRFLLTPAARAHPNAEQQARHLAQAEQDRLGQAQLYHLDDQATQRALITPPAQQDARELAPSTAGFVVWSRPVARTDSGVPVVAASWGPAEEYGTWVSWWSDTAETARIHNLDVDLQLNVNGLLMYEREAWLLPGPPPSQLEQPENPEYGVYQALYGTWSAIAHGALQADEKQPQAMLCNQIRQAGLEERRVHVYRALPDQTPSVPPTKQRPTRDDAYDAAFTADRDRDLAEPFHWIPALYRSATGRVQRIEAQLARRWPEVFERLETMHAHSSGHWPQWCWMPIGRVATVLGEIAPQSTMAAQAAEASKVAAIAAWRASGRPIINMHDDLVRRFSRLSHSEAVPLPRDLPQRWHVPCVYVTEQSPDGTSGFWVHLDWDNNEHRCELRILLDVAPVADSGELSPQPIHLTGSTLYEALSATWSTGAMRMRSLSGSDDVPATGPGTQFDDSIRQMTRSVGIYAAIADYLASEPIRFDDARQVLARGDAAPWPPPRNASEPIRMWLVPDKSMWIS